MSFEKLLQWGKDGERDVENYLRYQGCTVMPSTDAIRDGKGARIWGKAKAFVAPDLLVFHRRFTLPRWVEVKRKAQFSFYRKYQTWTTGIDLYYFNEYKLVSDITSLPVWLFFWHDKSQLDFATSGLSPTGLFGNDIKILDKSHSHKYTGGKYGTGGMIYFTPSHLKKIATVEDVMLANKLYERKDAA